MGGTTYETFLKYIKQFHAYYRSREMSQATQPNATQPNATQPNATQPEVYVMEETPAPKPRFIPGAPRGRTYRRTSGHWVTNLTGNVIWISSPSSSPHMTGYNKLNQTRSMQNMRSMRRFPPAFSRKKEQVKQITRRDYRF